MRVDDHFEFIVPQTSKHDNSSGAGPENFNSSAHNKRSVHVPNADNRVLFELTTISNNEKSSKQFTTAQMSSIIPRGIHDIS